MRDEAVRPDERHVAGEDEHVVRRAELAQTDRASRRRCPPASFWTAKRDLERELRAVERALDLLAGRDDDADRRQLGRPVHLAQRLEDVAEDRTSGERVQHLRLRAAEPLASVPRRARSRRSSASFRSSHFVRRRWEGRTRTAITGSKVPGPAIGRPPTDPGHPRQSRYPRAGGRPTRTAGRRARPRRRPDTASATARARRFVGGDADDRRSGAGDERDAGGVAHRVEPVAQRRDELARRQLEIVVVRAPSVRLRRRSGRTARTRPRSTPPRPPRRARPIRRRTTRCRVRARLVRTPSTSPPTRIAGTSEPIARAELEQLADGERSRPTRRTARRAPPRRRRCRRRGRRRRDRLVQDDHRRRRLVGQRVARSPRPPRCTRFDAVLELRTVRGRRRSGGPGASSTAISSRSAERRSSAADR